MKFRKGKIFSSAWGMLEKAQGNKRQGCSLVVENFMCKARSLGLFSISSSNSCPSLFSQRSVTFVPPLHPSQTMHHLEWHSFWPPHQSLPGLPSLQLLPLQAVSHMGPSGLFGTPRLDLSFCGPQPSHGSPLALRGNPEDLVRESLQEGWDWEWKTRGERRKEPWH